MWKRPVSYASMALGVLLLALVPRTVAADTIAIAAASDLQSALPELVNQFQARSGHQVRVTYGSSGNFFAQIQNGAPFDVYCSADVDYPKRLEAAGLAEPGTRYDYAIGRLVVWTRSGSPIDVSRGLSVLASAAVRRIAIANPDHAPYGRAAVAAMHNAGIYDVVKRKLVLGENISQAAQFVESGNADVAILALSVSLGPGGTPRGVSQLIPESMHPPIEQAAIAIRASAHKAAARAFLDFLKTPEAIATLRRYGFAKAS